VGLSPTKVRTFGVSQISSHKQRNDKFATRFATRASLATVQVLKKLYCFIQQTTVHLKLIALLSVFFFLPFVLSSLHI
jgi:hypothetical protein